MVPTAAASVKPNIIIASASSNPTLFRIASDASEELISNNLDTTLIDVDKSTFSILDNADLIITVGNQVSKKIIKQFRSKAILSVNTSPVAFDTSSKIRSQLTLKQPVCRQFRLINSLSASFKSVSVITGDLGQTSELQRCADSNHLKLLLIHPKPRENLTSLISKALQSDVILATPDKEIYNRSTVKSILLRSYRKRVPVIGFSKSFATAGALAAVHSTPEQIASQIYKLVLTYTQTGVFNSRQYYPDDFSVTINRQVSHSLNINTPTEGQLEAMLKQDVTQ